MAGGSVNYTLVCYYKVHLTKNREISQQVLGRIPIHDLEQKEEKELDEAPSVEERRDFVFSLLNTAQNTGTGSF